MNNNNNNNNNLTKDELIQNLNQISKQIQFLKKASLESFDNKTMLLVQFYDQMHLVDSELDKLMIWINEIETKAQIISGQTQHYPLLQNEFEQNRNLITLIKHINQIQQKFELFEEHSEENQYLNCVKDIKEIETQINSLTENIKKLLKEEQQNLDKIEEANFLKIMYQEYIRKKSFIEQILIQTLENYFIFNENEIQMQILLEISKISGIETISSPIKLNEIIESLFELKMIESKLENIFDKFLQKIIIPIITNPKLKMIISKGHQEFTIQCVFDPTTQFENETSNVTHAFTQIHNSHLVVIQDIMMKLNQVLTAFFNSIFADKNNYQDVSMKLGTELFTKITDLLIKNWLEKSNPTKYEGAQCFFKIEKIYAQTQISLKYLYRSWEWWERMKQDCPNIWKIWSENFWIKNMTKSYKQQDNFYCLQITLSLEISDETERTALSTFDMAGGKDKKGKTGISGKDWMKNVEKFDKNQSGNSEYLAQFFEFRLPTMKIQSSTQRLVELAYQTLEEACSSESSKFAWELYQSTRDIFDMYLVLVPNFHGSNIAETSHLSALFYHDCMYISHHLLTLGARYRDRLPEPLNRTSSFIDFVPLFRDLGENWHSQQLQSQAAHLRSLLKDIYPLFANLDSYSTPRVESALLQISAHVERLSNSWKDILTSEILIGSLGKILSILLRDIVDNVLLLSDIYEPVILHGLLSKLLVFIPRILFKSDSQTNQKDSDDVHVDSDVNLDSDANVKRYVSVWKRFKTLLIFLKDGLKEIVEKVRKNEIEDFFVEEVIHLIQAIFEKSVLREQSIEDIKVMMKK
ncbi:centromere/kinetochore protein zw10 [Anaeramoeba ignava]|uniref:Centromere/kinetochore protein zw10 n=1 Tax=Anaeramoeba ignava TaxID=1746090 RepID=A0A9Q0R8A6_ANAIG|nr:centromere/kinetochore protein zw10 [Anaeramoeba ignava]